MKIPRESLTQDNVDSSDRLWQSEGFIQDLSTDLDSQTGTLYGGTVASVTIPSTEDLQDKLDGLQPQKTTVPQTAQNKNWSTSLQTVLDQPPSVFPYYLILGGMAFCVAFMAWAKSGQIEEVGKATGRLVPKGEPYKVHPVVSGKVANLYIKEGQTVKAGQVIAQLDKEIALNEIQRLQQEQAAFKQELVQTEALIDKTRLEAQSRAAITKAEVQGQQATIASVNAKIESQKAAIASSKQKATISQILLNQLKVDVTAKQERIQRFNSLVQQGAIAKEQLFQVQQDLGVSQRSITQQIGEIQLAQVESNRLQADLQQVLAERTRMQAALTQKQAEGKTTLLQAEQTIQKLQVEKTNLLAKIQQVQKQQERANTELKQLSLTAPVNGVVLALNVRNSGEVVQTGQTLAEIAPQTAPLVLQAILPSREAGFVKIGNTAQIKFDAYPFQDYGIVSGKVISISPDTKQSEQLGAVYRVEISLNRNYVIANHQTIKFKPGQTATAEIIIRRRHIADILLDPIRQLQSSGISL